MAFTLSTPLLFSPQLHFKNFFFPISAAKSELAATPPPQNTGSADKSSKFLQLKDVNIFNPVPNIEALFFTYCSLMKSFTALFFWGFFLPILIYFPISVALFYISCSISFLRCIKFNFYGAKTRLHT